MPALKETPAVILEPTNTESSLHRRILYFLCLLLALKVMLFLAQAWGTIVYPFEWSTMDGYYVFYGLRLLAGEPIYFDYQSLLMPFEYVPVYPAVIGGLARLFGTGVWYERMFSVSCALAMAAIIARAVYKGSSSVPASACAGLLFLAPAPLSVWYLVRGIDNLAALTALAAVALIADSRENIWRVLLSSLLFVVAVFTKQTAVFPAGAVFLYLVLNRRWRDASILGAGGASVSVIILLVFQRLSDGWFFENAFLMTSRNPYYLWLLGRLSMEFALILFVSLPLGIYQTARKIKSPQSVWSFYFIVTLAAACLSAKAGAALSYFIPLFSAVCIMTGLWLGDEVVRSGRSRARTLVFLLLVLQAMVFFTAKNVVPTKEDYRQAAALDDWIKQRPGPILLERIDSFAVRNDRELHVEAVQLPVLIMHRRYDPAIVIEAVQEKYFSLIIYSGVYFNGIPSIKRAISDNYQVVDEVELGLFFGKMKFLILIPA